MLNGAGFATIWARAAKQKTTMKLEDLTMVDQEAELATVSQLVRRLLLLNCSDTCRNIGRGLNSGGGHLADYNLASEEMAK